MYTPTKYEETDTDILHGLIRAHPLGALVTMTPSGLDANHIPFLIQPTPAPNGTLHGHVARANSVWRESSKDVEALVIFQGPQHYISPSWLPTKKETAKVVPTWNYVVVHVHGALRVIDDPAWLRQHLEQLTDQNEATRTVPWHVTDAPADYVEKLVTYLIGIEIPISRISGKWKVSQNLGERDRDGVVQGLTEEGRESAIAMANLVRQARMNQR